MVQYVIQYDIMALIITVILFYSYLFMPAKNKRLRRVYLMMIVVVFACGTLDIISSVMLMNPSDNKIFNDVLYFVTALYNVAHIVPLPLVAYYMYYSINDEDMSTRSHTLIGLPVLFALITIVINSFTGIIFTIENGIYSRGKYMYVMYIITLIYLLGILVYFIIHYRVANRAFKFVTFCYVIISGIGMIIQYLYPSQLVECASMAIILLAVHFAIQSKDTLDEAVRTQTEIAEAANIANKAKTEFLANMSHEIRTPISTMMGINHMIMRESESLVIKKYAQDSQRAGKVLMSLVDDILDVSKIESGNMIIREEPYRVESLVGIIIDEISPRVSEKGLDFIVNVDPVIPKTLIGDATRIHQVIINLMSNAVKYTKRGYVELNISYIRVNENELILKVSVKDSGIGIKNEDKPYVATRFQRFDIDNNRNIEGAGLGLSISNQILGLMDGYLDFESKVGVGSNFFFEIKQKIDDNSSLGSINWFDKYSLIYEDTEKFIAPDAFILIVDDNDMNLNVFRKMLKANGTKVIAVSSGEECIRACKKIKFDVIFLDYMMPHMDGEETLQILRGDEEGLNQDTAVVVLTANAIAGAKERYLDCGFNDYISKPIDYNTLQDLLMKHIPRDKQKVVE